MPSVEQVKQVVEATLTALKFEHAADTAAAKAQGNWLGWTCLNAGYVEKDGQVSVYVNDGLNKVNWEASVAVRKALEAEFGVAAVARITRQGGKYKTWWTYFENGTPRDLQSGLRVR